MLRAFDKRINRYIQILPSLLQIMESILSFSLSLLHRRFCSLSVENRNVRSANRIFLINKYIAFFLEMEEKRDVSMTNNLPLETSICLSTVSLNRIIFQKDIKKTHIHTKFGLSRINKPIYENRFIKHGCIA